MIPPEQSAHAFQLLKFPGTGPRIAARTPDERELLAAFRFVGADARVVLLQVLAVFVTQEREQQAIEKGGA